MYVSRLLRRWVVRSTFKWTLKNHILLLANWRSCRKLLHWSSMALVRNSEDCSQGRSRLFSSGAMLLNFIALDFCQQSQPVFSVLNLSHWKRWLIPRWGCFPLLLSNDTMFPVVRFSIQSFDLTKYFNNIYNRKYTNVSQKRYRSNGIGIKESIDALLKLLSQREQWIVLSEKWKILPANQQRIPLQTKLDKVVESATKWKTNKQTKNHRGCTVFF